jgi:ubiquinone/menaquinone biosynthesis C-methylase UbiE
MPAEDLKSAINAYWTAEPCGTRDVSAADRALHFREIERERYTLEPYIPSFAGFDCGRGKRVLEIGVGAGTDFVNWIRHGANGCGIDLTAQGVRLTLERLRLEKLNADVMQADAENLPFPANHFDIVYSYGVLHHSPDTARAVTEVHRVPKSGGTARIMVDHINGLVCWLVWAAHCLLHLRPWRGRRWAICRYLESPGTKAYSIPEAKELFSSFTAATFRTQLGHGDLLLMRPNARYRKWYHRLVWKLYPRWAVRLTGSRFGTGLLIEAIK